MLPTGEVMFWGNSFPNEPRNRGNAALWDPSKGYGSDAFTEVPPPRIDPDGAGPQGTDPSAPLLLRVVDAGQRRGLGHRRQPRLARPVQGRSVHGLRGAQPRLHLQPLDPEVDGTAPDERRPLVPGAGRACRWPDGDSRRIYGRGARRHLRQRSRGLHARPAAWRGRLAGPRAVCRAHERPCIPTSSPSPTPTSCSPAPGGRTPRVLRTADFTWTEYPRAPQGRTGGNAVLNPGPPSGSWRVTQIGGYDRRSRTPRAPTTPPPRPRRSTRVPVARQGGRAARR